MTTPTIPFTRVHVTGKEIEYMRQVIETSRLGGDGPFSRRCEQWLERTIGCRRALLTHSGTGALDMAAILAGIEPGDEVILPSFTFASTANAFVLRGAVPVFVDIEADTMNLDAECVARALSPRTRAIVAVHYAGAACRMDAILALAGGANAMVIEDAAQALLSTHDGRPLGSFGAMAVLSFHETKNVTSGEGGCLLVNDASLVARAEIVREKGTNRTAFRRGAIDRYTWVDIGSSFLPNELTAAFLLAQLEASHEITARRCAIWEQYHAALAPLEADGLLARPGAGPGNAHIYFVLLPDSETRTDAIATLREQGIVAVFHYVPLHDSPAGRRYGRAAGPLPVTDNISARLLRLPLWPDMSGAQVAAVADALASALGR